MSIGWIKCPQCGEEYYIKHIKFPFKDDGSSLECLKCNTTLHRWGKGTDDYILKTKEVMRKEQEYEESRPTCVCGSKMTRKNGPNGLFWGCSRFPNCRHTQLI